MNIIQRAVLRGLHNTQNKKASASDWKIFRKECADKRLVIFGGTLACDYFLGRHPYGYRPECILDNNKDRQGHFYVEFAGRPLPGSRKGLKVEGPEVLNQYSPERTVVLIASTNHYEEIAEQLEKLGFSNYFVLCIMEARRWRYRLFALFMGRKKRLEEAVYRKTGWSVRNFRYILQFYRERRYPVQRDKIVFHTFGGYMDHGKYIAEEILRQGRKWDMVWLVSDRDAPVPAGIRKVPVSDIAAYIHELATAAVWVNDVMYPYFVRKRKGQYYIQTKHWGGVTLKKFYFDAPSLYSFPAEIRNWKRNSRMMDCMITGSEFDTQSCRSGFRFSGEIWWIGSPRSDILFKKTAGKRVYDCLGIKEGTRLLLYAPTYRFLQDDSRNRPEARDFGMDYAGLLEALVRKFGGEWTILLRLHPSVARQGAGWKLPGFVIDASRYPDSQELVAACSVMISDYSSIIFEPCYVKKPVFLYTVDQKQYVREEYELLIGIDELPFPVAEDGEELIHHILSYDEKRYCEAVDAFLKAYGVHEDGHACERAVERMDGLMEKNR